LFTVRIKTETKLVAVAGGFVLVGTSVAVPVGTVGVDTCVSVGGAGVVGSAVGAAKVGKTVAPKLNKAVGVAWTP
jgi:hypothetical protein